MCDEQPISASAALSNGERLTQIEYDAYVFGIQDLLTLQQASLSDGQDIIEGIFSVLLNPSLLGPDVRNNRGLPELLEQYARILHAEAATVSRRQAGGGGSCVVRDTVLRIGALASVETITKASSATFNGMELESDTTANANAARHVAQLPSQVYESNVSCVTLTHITFFTTASFRTAARSSGSLPTSPLLGASAYEVRMRDDVPLSPPGASKA